MIGRWAPLLADPGEKITRAGARDAAHREVSRGVYHAHQPGLVRRFLERAADWLGNLLDHAAGVAPGGAAGLVAILLLLVGLVVLLLSRSGPLRGTGRRTVWDAADGSVLGADDHRRAADGHAAAGRYAEAVRERMRAIARELESRGVLEPRPGRTAEEVAADAGHHLPDLAGDLRRAARIFDEVWYGGRPATGDLAALLRDVDLRVRAASLRVDPPVGSDATVAR